MDLVAFTISWLSDWPCRISPLTAIGRMRTSPAASLSFRETIDLIPAREIPTSDQLLREPFAAGGCQFEEIFGTIDIAGDTRQFQHNARQVGGVGGGSMGQEAVVTEAEREQICRRSPRCIGSASSRIGHQERTGRRSVVQNGLKF